MPYTEAGLQATDDFRKQLLNLRAAAVQGTARGFRDTVDLDNVAPSFRRFILRTAGTIAAAQTLAVDQTNRYFAEYLASELEQAPASTPTVPPSSLAGKTEFGRTLLEGLQPIQWTVLRALGERRGRDHALQAGLNRLSRLTSSETLAASRTALDSLMEASTHVVIGWRRVCSLNACGACLAAAHGELEQVGNRLRVHPHCRCTKEPVVTRDGSEQYLRPTGRQIFDGKSPSEQAELFHGRGGAEKARLIREGEISLDDLLVPLRSLTGDGITEAPLSALV